MKSYSRRELYAAGEFLGDSATQNKVGGGRIYGGGGGGGPTTSTVTQSNIPDWLRPQTEALLGAATQEYFQTKPVVDPETGKTTYEITGVKPYTPYSTNPQDYIAGFTPQQQAVFSETANMYRPEQYGMATRYADIAGQGGLGSAQQAYGYGQAGYGSGMLGQNLGIQGGQRYGEMGAGYGQQAAGLAGEQAEEPRPPGRSGALATGHAGPDPGRRLARGGLCRRAGERHEGLARRGRLPGLPQGRRARHPAPRPARSPVRPRLSHQECGRGVQAGVRRGVIFSIENRTDFRTLSLCNGSKPLSRSASLT